MKPKSTKSKTKTIAGFIAKGETLTTKEYNLRLKKAMRLLASGKFICQKDLEKELGS